MSILFIASFQQEYKAAYEKTHRLNGDTIQQKIKMKPEEEGMQSVQVVVRLLAEGCKVSLEIPISQ